MQPKVADDPSVSCSFLGALIELLHNFPAGDDLGAQRVFSASLAQLNDTARLHKAPEETLAAIRGAWVLLDLSKRTAIPPLRY